jgi:tetratricopeptide (TPR) repeat protein
MNASLFSRDNDYDGAFKDLREALALNPRNGSYCETLGIVQLAHGDVNESIDSFGRSIAMYPASAAFRRWYGTAQYYAGNYEAARQYLSESLDLSPLALTAYYLLLTADMLHDPATSECAREMGVRERIAENVRRTAHEDVDARFMLALMYNTLRKENAAREILSKQTMDDVAFVDWHFVKMDPHFKSL